jgi:hypothetical protein
MFPRGMGILAHGHGLEARDTHVMGRDAHATTINPPLMDLAQEYAPLSAKSVQSLLKRDRGFAFQFSWLSIGLTVGLLVFMAGLVTSRTRTAALILPATAGWLILLGLSLLRDGALRRRRLEDTARLIYSALQSGRFVLHSGELILEPSGEKISLETKTLIALEAMRKNRRAAEQLLEPSSVEFSRPLYSDSSMVPDQESNGP